MKLSRRPSSQGTVDQDAAVAVEPNPAGEGGKGRPTPKRRDIVGVRGPVTAPKTRKEAYARQKAHAKTVKTVSRKPQNSMTVAERRTLLKAGDPAVLPRRDQGNTRKLARDYVDSHRMASNYFLMLFPLMIAGGLIPGLAIVQLVTLALAVGFIGEWYVVGRRIRRMAMERFGEAQGGNMTIGFYAGSRAYLMRRWRLPAAQVEIGDEI